MKVKLSNRLPMCKAVLAAVFWIALSGAFQAGTSEPASAAPAPAASNAAAPPAPPSKSGLPAPDEPKTESAGTGVAAGGPVQSPENDPSLALAVDPRLATSGVAWGALISGVLALLLSASALALLLMKLRPLEDRLARLEESSERDSKHRNANDATQVTRQLSRVEDELAALQADLRKLSQRIVEPPAAPPFLTGRSSGIANAKETTILKPPVAAPPPRYRPLEPEALLRVVMGAVYRVAESNSSITSANVVGKIRSEVQDPAMLSELGRAAFTIDLFDAGGKKAAQSPELMAVRFASAESGAGAARCYVMPFPQAGRVARFRHWFRSDGEYQTNPVLALTPAVAELGADGVLQMVKSGTLLKA